MKEDMRSYSASEAIAEYPDKIRGQIFNVILSFSWKKDFSFCVLPARSKILSLMAGEIAL